jgi:CDP-diacylglycerol--glycerol-3-phosphate 3-phosphatidyltransferase
MHVRRVLPCLRQASSSTARRHVAKYGRVQRRYSSTSSGTAAAPIQSSAAPIASITNELDKISPRFDVPAESIEILRTPAEFYATLKAREIGSIVCTLTDKKDRPRY